MLSLRSCTCLAPRRQRKQPRQPPPPEQKSLAEAVTVTVTRSPLTRRSPRAAARLSPTPAREPATAAESQPPQPWPEAGPQLAPRERPRDRPAESHESRQEYSAATGAGRRRQTLAVSSLEWSSSLSSAADSPAPARCTNTDPLPPGWRLAERDGSFYCYNRRTGKRLWHHPSGCDCPTGTPMLPLKTLSTASSGCSEDGGNTPLAPRPATAYYYKRGWHGAAPTSSSSTASSAARTASTGTALSSRTVSAATSGSLPVSDRSPLAHGRDRVTTSRTISTRSVASTAAAFPPPPTPVAERGLLVQQWQGAPRRSIVKMLAQLDREILTETSDEFSLATPSEAVPPSSARPTVRERRGSIDAESVASSVPASIPDEPAEAAKLEAVPERRPPIARSTERWDAEEEGSSPIDSLRRKQSPAAASIMFDVEAVHEI